MARRTWVSVGVGVRWMDALHPWAWFKAEVGVLCVRL